jgi:hypothetical protein
MLIRLQNRRVNPPSGVGMSYSWTGMVSGSIVSRARSSEARIFPAPPSGSVGLGWAGNASKTGRPMIPARVRPVLAR